MSVYVDASVLVALFVADSLTETANEAIERTGEPLVLSNLTSLEVASVIARKVRNRDVSAKDGRIALANFDGWAILTQHILSEPADVAAADAIVRRFDVNLHGADAIHVAIAMRAGASLLTLDDKMRRSARKLGLSVI